VKSNAMNPSRCIVFYIKDTRNIIIISIPAFATKPKTCYVITFSKKNPQGINGLKGSLPEGYKFPWM
jgi:hypothetical protein